MRSRAFRPTAAILSILLLAGTPVHAGPVVVSEVLQVLSSLQNPPSLRLRSDYYGSSTVVSKGSVGSSSSLKQLPIDVSLNVADISGLSAGTTTDSLLSGIAVSSTGQEVGVDVDQGDVEGTICDCGEISVSGGGFPKWPLLFLAAIPFFFIHGCDDCETPTPTPTPTPTAPPNAIPEPATMFLFGTGLAAFGAGLRRRRSKRKLNVQAQTEEG